MRLRRFLGFLVVAYAAAIGLLHVLWRTPALGWSWLQLLNIFGLWLYLPLPLMLLLGLLVRPRRLVLLLLVPLCAFAWEYAPFFAPQRTAAEGQSLRVMSWNILFRNRDIAAVVGLIRQNSPDVVALQELSGAQAAALTPLLERDYPFHALNPAPGNNKGNGLGVWSRYPLAEVAPPENRLTDGCACQRLHLDVEGRRVRLVNVHPTIPLRFTDRYLWEGGPRIPSLSTFNTRRQEPAIAAIEAEAQANPASMIVVGDFNTHDRQPNYWRLRRYLEDAHRDVGRGFGLTFPSNGVWSVPFPPFLRLDYVFHTPDLVATRAWNVGDPSSDHRAILADLVIGETTSSTAAVGRTPAPSLGHHVSRITQHSSVVRRSSFVVRRSSR